MAMTSAISIHALRMEGDLNSIGSEDQSAISIHALRMEGDVQEQMNQIAISKFLSTPSAWRATASSSAIGLSYVFLSTPSAWRATYTRPIVLHHRLISIHALRMEGDITLGQRIGLGADFYPRPPHGGRQIVRNCIVNIFCISIHALRMEGDWNPLGLSATM